MDGRESRTFGTSYPIGMITAVMKARNEELRIGKAVERLSWCDSIIVVDDDSDDDTAECAEKLGALVFRYTRQTNSVEELDRAGFLLVDHGWILRIDVDEEVPPSLQSAMRQAVAEGDSQGFNGVLVARDNVFLGKVLKSGSTRRPHHLKLFRASAWDRSWDIRIHSQVPVEGSLRVLHPDTHGAVLHPLYDKLSDFTSRSLVHYARVEASQKGEVKHCGPVLLVLMACNIFFKTLLGQVAVKGAWRDGWRGALWSLLQAIYRLMVFAYQVEISSNPKADSSDRSWWHHR